MVISIGNINLQNHLLCGETNPSPKKESLRIIIPAPMENKIVVENTNQETITKKPYLADNPKLQATHITNLRINSDHGRAREREIEREIPMKGSSAGEPYR